jgi:hypothetical protein
MATTIGRMYSASFGGVSVSVAQDLFQIKSASGKITRIHEVTITQDTSENSETLPFQMHRGTTEGTGGGTPQAAALDQGDAPFGGVVEINNTTRSTAGSVIKREAQNILAGIHWLFTPETRPTISPEGILIMGLETAPGAALNMSGTILLEEIP